jgi:hypothetical protein
MQWSNKTCPSRPGIRLLCQTIQSDPLVRILPWSCFFVKAQRILGRPTGKCITGGLGFQYIISPSFQTSSPAILAFQAYLQRQSELRKPFLILKSLTWLKLKQEPKYRNKARRRAMAML